MLNRAQYDDEREFPVVSRKGPYRIAIRVVTNERPDAPQGHDYAEQAERATWLRAACAAECRVTPHDMLCTTLPMAQRAVRLTAFACAMLTDLSWETIGHVLGNDGGFARGAALVVECALWDESGKSLPESAVMARNRQEEAKTLRSLWNAIYCMCPWAHEVTHGRMGSEDDAAMRARIASLDEIGGTA